MKRILIAATILAILTINVVVAQTTPVLNNQQLTGVVLKAVAQYKALKEKHEELVAEVGRLKNARTSTGNLDARYVGMFDTQHKILLKGQLIGVGYTTTEANEFVDPLAQKVKKAFRSSSSNSKGFKEARKAGDQFLKKMEELTIAKNEEVGLIIGSVAVLSKGQQKLASKEAVALAIATSEQSMRLEMEENLEELKKLVRGYPSTVAPMTVPMTVDDRKIDAVAKAAVLGTVGEVEASLNAFANIYSEGWVEDILGSIPDPVAD